jgi:hypothetical protein
VPVLPIIDLLILLGWSALMAGGALKAIHMTTTYRPSIFGLAPSDCLLIAGVFLTFALTLAARTWVKLNEPTLLARRRARGFDSGEPESSDRESEGEPTEARGRRRLDER